MVDSKFYTVVAKVAVVNKLYAVVAQVLLKIEL